MRKLKRRQVYMTDEEVKIAQWLGGGNMSKGIREALKMADSIASSRSVEKDQPHCDAIAAAIPG